MATFYICRHGETLNNKAHRIMGWIDTPLTEEGERSPLTVASKLRDKGIDLIISSDLGRAFTTAYIISRALHYSGEIIRSAGLREVNYGDLANLPYDQFPVIDPHEYADYVFPGGESLNQMKVRVLSEVGSVATRGGDKTVLIVAHDGTINALRSEYEGIGMAEADKTSHPHDYVAGFEWHEGAIRELREVT